MFAESLEKELRRTAFSVATGKKQSKLAYFSRMVSELLVMGQTQFLDGREIAFTPDQWKDFSKFWISHMDGKADQDAGAQFNALQQVFKIYAGIDVDQV